MLNATRSGARRALGLGAAGGLLALTVLLTGAGPQARADDEPTPRATVKSAPDGRVYTRRVARRADDPKKDDASKTDNAKKDNATRADEPARGGGRAPDTDLQRQIDQLRREVDELRRNMDRGARIFPVPPNFPGAPNFP